MLKTLSITLIALSVAMAADPTDAPRKSDAELLYEKALEANMKEAEKAYSQYQDVLGKATAKVLKALEGAKADLNDPKKGKLSITERAAAIAEIDKKIEEVKKGSVGEVIVGRAKASGDLIGEKAEKVDVRSNWIGKWKFVINNKPEASISIDKKYNVAHSDGVNGQLSLTDGNLTIVWNNGTKWSLQSNGDEHTANGKIILYR